MKTTKHVLAAAALSSTALLTACTGLEPAVLGAAFTGARTGVTMLTGAEVWDFREVEFERMIDAVDIVGERMALERLNERTGPEYIENGRYWIYFRYEGWQRLVVEVRRLTPTITSIEIVTRAKNQQGMAQLFMEMMLEEIENGRTTSE